MFAHRLHLLLLVIQLALSLPQSAHATRFSTLINRSKRKSSKDPTFFTLDGLQSTVFGLSRNGSLNATLQFDSELSGDCQFKLALCVSSSYFVRSPGFERRHPPDGLEKTLSALARRSCGLPSEKDSGQPVSCLTRTLQFGKKTYEFKTLPGFERELYTVFTVLCSSGCEGVETANLKLQGLFHYSNPGTQFPELGYEEAVFPILAAICTGILGLVTVMLLLGMVVGLICRMPVPSAAIIVFFASTLKGMTAGLTFLYFWDVAQSGSRAGWYLYIRLTLSAVADISYIVVLMGLSSGYRILPSAWFVDGRSPVFVVYIGVTLQAVISIAVKIMFPFRYLGSFLASLAHSNRRGASLPTLRVTADLGRLCGPRYLTGLAFSSAAILCAFTILYFALSTMRLVLHTGVVTYTIAAGSIAIVTCLASYRNLSFLRRYSDLIEQSHIYVRTTPVCRMQRFYCINMVIVSVVYVFKLINLGLSDYNLERPDLTWAGLELTDAILLLWYAIAVLPRRKSAIYVDMSNVSNGRLQEAEAWRTTQAERANPETQLSSPRRLTVQDATSDSESHTESSGTEERSNAANGELSVMEEGRRRAVMTPPTDPHPPWVSWTSGMSLPRPSASTWGGYAPVSRILRRDRRLVPVLPPSIVLGTPTEEAEILTLTIGMPTAGPRSVPMEFDEKGMEIARDSGDGSHAAGSVAAGDQTAGDGNAAEEASDQVFERLRGLPRGLQRLWLRGGTNDTAGLSVGDSDAIEGNTGGGEAEWSAGETGLLPVLDGSQGVLSRASSNASCDGVIFPRDDEAGL